MGSWLGLVAVCSQTLQEPSKLAIAQTVDEPFIVSFASRLSKPLVRGAKLSFGESVSFGLTKKSVATSALGT